MKGVKTTPVVSLENRLESIQKSFDQYLTSTDPEKDIKKLDTALSNLDFAVKRDKAAQGLVLKTSGNATTNSSATKRLETLNQFSRKHQIYLDVRSFCIELKKNSNTISTKLMDTIVKDIKAIITDVAKPNEEKPNEEKPNEEEPHEKKPHEKKPHEKKLHLLYNLLDEAKSDFDMKKKSSLVARYVIFSLFKTEINNFHTRSIEDHKNKREPGKPRSTAPLKHTPANSIENFIDTMLSGSKEGAKISLSSLTDSNELDRFYLKEVKEKNPF